MTMPISGLEQQIQVRRVLVESLLDREFEASAHRGVIPADRGAGPMELVRQVYRGQKPAALFHARPGMPTSIQAVAWAQWHGLSLRITPPEEAGAQEVAVASDDAALNRLLDAYAMDWDIRRNIAIGQALGYSRDDINAFIKRVLGQRPTPDAIERDRQRAAPLMAREAARNPNFRRPFTQTKLHDSLTNPALGFAL